MSLSPLDFELLRMSVQSTVVDLSGRTQYDLDGITRELVKHGVNTYDDFSDIRDPDWFWSVIEDHEIIA